MKISKQIQQRKKKDKPFLTYLGMRRYVYAFINGLMEMIFERLNKA